MFTAGLCCVTWEQPESQAPHCDMVTAEQGIRVYTGIISRGQKRGFTGREGKRLWKETCAGCALLLLVPWQWERVPSWYPSSRRVCPLGIWAVRRHALLVPRQWEDVPSWYFSSGSCCLQLQMSVNQSGNEKRWTERWANWPGTDEVFDGLWACSQGQTPVQAQCRLLHAMNLRFDCYIGSQSCDSEGEVVSWNARIARLSRVKAQLEKLWDWLQILQGWFKLKKRQRRREKNGAFWGQLSSDNSFNKISCQMF